jgi:hypothetical protein
MVESTSKNTAAATPTRVSRFVERKKLLLPGILYKILLSTINLLPASARVINILSLLAVLKPFIHDNSYTWTLIAD